MDKRTKHFKDAPMRLKRRRFSAFSSIFGQVKLALFAMGILLGHLGMAQGWELTFGGDKYDEGTAIAEAIDGGYILVGFSESFGSDNDLDVYVVRTDIDGNVLWNRVYDEGFMEHGFDVLSEDDGTFLVVGDVSAQSGSPLNTLLLKLSKEGKPLWIKTYEAAGREVGKTIVRALDGGYLIAGSSETGSGETKMLVLKVDTNGNFQWRKTYGPAGDAIAEAIIATEDGYYLAGNADRPNRIDTDIVLYKIDKTGREVWTEPLIISTSEADEVYDMIETSDGGIVIAGRQMFNSDAYIAKLSKEREILWEKRIGGDLGDLANGIIELSDSSLVMVGFSEISEINPDILVAKLSADGKELWRSTLGEPIFTEDGRQIVATRDGKFAIVGLKSEAFSGQLNKIILIKTDDQGNTITNYVSGKVFYDVDEGCNGYDLTRDIPLRDWLVRVSSKESSRVYYGTTDAEGNYRIRVDTGSYNVSVLPINNYWSSCVSEGYEIDFLNFYDTLSRNFPIIPETTCSYLEVDISTPFLAPCTEVIYSIDYRNTGTDEAQDAFVEVTLDPVMTFVAASLTPVAQDGNVFRFDLGDIPIEDRGSFTVTTSTETACSEGGIADGQAALAQARIFPDSLCIEPDPRWDGSNIEVTGDCNTTLDSVRFLIKNTGFGNMSEPRAAIVIQDDVILLQGNGLNRDYKLDAGEAVPIPVPVENGSTYRLIAIPDAYHPFQRYPTAFVEGCPEEGEAIKTGFVTMFPENDPDPNTSIDIQEIIGSDRSVELRGYPKGYGDSLIVASNTDITYTVFFRNVGTDTITRVVIRDTLSTHLDLTTVTPGAGSHPYDFELYDNGILKITFSDIELLPEGNGDNASSYGFIKFRVSQKPDNPIGTMIDNSAAVYFDYHKPENSNLVRYFSGDFPSYVQTKIITGVDQVVWPGVEIKVYPNPFVESAVIKLEGYEFKEVILNVFDAAGRLQQTSRHLGNEIMYYRNGLPSGLYFFRLESEGQLVGSGKMLVR